MRSNVTALSISDDYADTLYAHGRFKEAAERYLLTAGTLPPQLAWPLRIKAVLSHLRRNEGRKSLIAAKNTFNRFLLHTEEHALFDVQLVEAWVWVEATQYQRAYERATQLLAVARRPHEMGQVYTLMSQLEWLQGDRERAHQLFDKAAGLLRGRDSRHARLDNLLLNLQYLSWPNRSVMVWRGFILVAQTGRLYDAIGLLRLFGPIFK